MEICNLEINRIGWIFDDQLSVTYTYTIIRISIIYIIIILVTFVIYPVSHPSVWLRLLNVLTSAYQYIDVTWDFSSFYTCINISVSHLTYCNIAELCSRTANDRVLNLELYTHRRQQLTLLHLFADLFRKEIVLTLQNKWLN